MLAEIGIKLVVLALVMAIALTCVLGLLEEADREDEDER